MVHIYLIFSFLFWQQSNSAILIQTQTLILILPEIETITIFLCGFKPGWSQAPSVWVSKFLYFKQPTECSLYLNYQNSIHFQSAKQLFQNFTIMPQSTTHVRISFRQVYPLSIILPVLEKDQSYKSEVGIVLY